MKQQTRGSLMLLLCAMVWGAAFVAQSEGMNYVGPFTMAQSRSIRLPRVCCFMGRSPLRKKLH